MAERSVILHTFSKKYAMTGWRLGAAVGPKPIIDQMARLAVNDESCTNNFIQYGGIEALRGDQSGAKQLLEVLRDRRDTAVEILETIPGVRCFKPQATFYLFPNVTEAMQRTGLTDYEAFRTRVLHETGVSFCSRLHFGRAQAGEAETYIRLAYSGINKDLIIEGLAHFKEFISRF